MLWVAGTSEFSSELAESISRIAHEGGINRRADGKVVRSAVGKSREALEPASWDLPDLLGKQAVIETWPRAPSGRISSRGSLQISKAIDANAESRGL